MPHRPLALLKSALPSNLPEGIQKKLASVSDAEALLQPLVKCTFLYGSIFSFC